MATLSQWRPDYAATVKKYNRTVGASLVSKSTFIARRSGDVLHLALEFSLADSVSDLGTILVEM